MFQEAINNYLQSHGYNTINLKAVLFDMDGVLFNSMPNHAESWHKVMLRFGFGLSRDEAYMHEGRTGASTINIVSRRERGHDATEEEIKAVTISSFLNMPGKLWFNLSNREVCPEPVTTIGMRPSSLIFVRTS